MNVQALEYASYQSPAVTIIAGTLYRSAEDVGLLSYRSARSTMSEANAKLTLTCLQR